VGSALSDNVEAPPVVPLVVTVSHAASEAADQGSAAPKLSRIVSVRVSAAPVGVLAKPTPQTDGNSLCRSALMLRVMGNAAWSPLTVAVSVAVADVEPGVTLAACGLNETVVPELPTVPEPEKVAHAGKPDIA
jgi:hypothetical protein